MHCVEKMKTISEKLTWKKRTICEKVLFCSLLSTLLAIVIAVIFSVQNFSGIVCQTEECISTSARLLKYMNQKIDPCDDFYEFSCGKYVENTPIPEDRIAISPIDEIVDKINENYRTILEKPIEDDEIQPFKFAKKLYKMCVNSTKTEYKEFQLFKKIFKDLGGWPVLEGTNWKENDFDWKETQEKFRKIGFYDNQFFFCYVGLETENSTRRIFTIQELSDGYVSILKRGFNDTMVRAYYDYLVDISILYGADKIQASKDMREYMEFRIKLAEIMSSSNERRNSSDKKYLMTIRELQFNIPSISWLDYINNKLEPFVTLTYDDQILVANPRHHKKLVELLDETSKRAIANHLFMSIAEHYEFNEEMRQKKLEYYKILFGVSSNSPQWQKCIHTDSFELARHSMYVRHFFKNNSKFEARMLLNSLKTVAVDMLKENSWMDDKTKEKAIVKVEDMRSLVSHRDELLNDDEINKYYEGAIINEESLLITSLKMRIWERNKILKKYHERYDKYDWARNSYPYYDTIFYLFSKNFIIVPAGILQLPFFDVDRPQYLNYGSLGYLIGSKIINSFDYKGKEYDNQGNYVNWWEQTTTKKFHEKTQCIIEKYSNYTVHNMTINGYIADISDIKMAYLAYQKWLHKNKEELKLPGLNYTPKQLFWISAATNWCTKVRPEYEKLIKTDYNYIPKYYKSIIPFINSDYFAKDFKCPVGSKMNPRNKCNLW